MFCIICAAFFLLCNSSAVGSLSSLSNRCSAFNASDGVGLGCIMLVCVGLAGLPLFFGWSSSSSSSSYSASSSSCACSIADFVNVCDCLVKRSSGVFQYLFDTTLNFFCLFDDFLNGNTRFFGTSSIRSCCCGMFTTSFSFGGLPGRALLSLGLIYASYVFALLSFFPLVWFRTSKFILLFFCWVVFSISIPYTIKFF